MAVVRENETRRKLLALRTVTRTTLRWTEMLRNGAKDFIMMAGRMSARRMAPVEVGLQSRSEKIFIYVFLFCFVFH